MAGEGGKTYLETLYVIIPKKGMPLENTPTSMCSPISSHWEQRVFVNEVMVASESVTAGAHLSAVTLALLEDSGWYLYRDRRV